MLRSIRSRRPHRPPLRRLHLRRDLGSSPPPLRSLYSTLASPTSTTATNSHCPERRRGVIEFSPLRDGWGDWFDKKSDFLRRDKMFKSNLEALNPFAQPNASRP
ncbi:hypothetical protein M0R45_013953 [Rubus argutus]|uniref:Uncharacterized protein n=1 Tax=Rubus argutus TaxID=59490 RepID=A0AAW1XKV3_RUBAR